MESIGRPLAAMPAKDHMPCAENPLPAQPDRRSRRADRLRRFLHGQQNLLLAGLFVFLIFYIGAVIFFAMVGVWCVLTFVKWPVLKVIGIVYPASSSCSW